MYDTDLAEVYDIIYAHGMKDYSAEADAIAKLIQARQPAAASLLDVACGTGQHLDRFRQLFTHVEGVELSSAMCAVASRRLPQTRISNGDMLDLSAVAAPASFDAVVCLFSAIGYLRSTVELDATAAGMASLLRPGGVLVIEPWFAPEQWNSGTVHDTVATHDGRTVMRMSHSSREGNISRMLMHYLVGDASGIRHFQDIHELTLFTDLEYAHAINASGLSNLEFLEGWSSGRGRIVATKPGLGDPAGALLPVRGLPTSS